MLSSWGVRFDAIDTEVQPEALQDLEQFGIPRVPAVVVGDRAVHGWNPQGVAELVGVSYDNQTQLSPQELTRRLDTILSAAQRAMRQVPGNQLELKTPGRDRTVRQLGYHIFRVAQSYPDAREQGLLSDTWFEAAPPPDLDSGPKIATYGEAVRQRLATWLQRDDAFAGAVNTYYGSQTAPELFERTVWHTAQHLRQLYALLDAMGIVPEEPLSDQDFEGLPLPQNVW